MFWCDSKPTISSTARKKLQYAAWIALAVLTVGCAGTGRLQLDHLDTAVSGITTSEIDATSEDGSIRWTGYRVRVPGKTLDYDYNYSRQSVVITSDITPIKKSRDGRSSSRSSVLVASDEKPRRRNGTGPYQLSVLDLPTGMPRWAARSNAALDIYEQDFVLLADRDRTVLEDTAGISIGTWTGPLYFSQNRVFRLGSKEFAKVDLRLGEDLWTRKGDAHVGFPLRTSYDGWLYVLADNLHGFDMETGEGWEREFRTHTVDHAKAVAKEALLACAAAMGGGYRTGGSVEPEVTQNRHSNILFLDGKLYFADMETINCLDPKTGDILWTTRLDRAYGTSRLTLAEQSIVFLGLGYKYIDGIVKPDGSPSVLLFDIQSGEPGPRHLEKIEDVITDFAWTQTRAAILTPRRLILLDHNLQLMAVRDSEGSLGDFLSVLENDDRALFLRTRNGVLAVCLESLDDLWSNRIGNAPSYEFSSAYQKTAWMDGARAVFDAGVAPVLELAGLHWMTTSAGRLLAVDIENEGKVVFEFNPGTSDMEFHTDCVISKDDAGLYYLPYSGLRVDWHALNKEDEADNSRLGF